MEEKFQAGVGLHGRMLHDVQVHQQLPLRRRPGTRAEMGGLEWLGKVYQRLKIMSMELHRN